MLHLDSPTTRESKRCGFANHTLNSASLCSAHSEVPSFMHQATSMSSCPCFLSFWPISLHVPHFPQCHLTTLHRHHTPMRTMKWLVAHTRALESVLGYATSHFMDFLFKLILFLGDLAPLTHTCTHTHTRTGGRLHAWRRHRGAQHLWREIQR